LEKEKLPPGESMLAQFVLEAPTAAVWRDRFIIRTFSPVNTIGGGEVLDVDPPRHKRFDAAALAGIRRFEGTLADAVEQVVRKRGGRSAAADAVSMTLCASPARVRESVSALAEAGRLKRIGTGAGERFVSAEVWRTAEEKAVTAVKKYFVDNPHKPDMPQADLQSQLAAEADETVFREIVGALVAAGTIVRKDGGLTLPGFEARLRDADQAAADKVEAVFRRAGFEPSLEDDVCRALRIPLSQFRKIMGTLAQQGKLVRLDPKVTMHRDAFEKAKKAIADYLRLRRTITIAEAKDVLRVSRKYACAVLEHLDKVGLTRRSGETHVLK
jgi:selenocysteine-specific elongation factor